MFRGEKVSSFVRNKHIRIAGTVVLAAFLTSSQDNTKSTPQTLSPTTETSVSSTIPAVSNKPLKTGEGLSAAPTEITTLAEPNIIVPRINVAENDLSTRYVPEDNTLPTERRLAPQIRRSVEKSNNHPEIADSRLLDLAVGPPGAKRQTIIKELREIGLYIMPGKSYSYTDHQTGEKITVTPKTATVRNVRVNFKPGIDIQSDLREKGIIVENAEPKQGVLYADVPVSKIQVLSEINRITSFGIDLPPIQNGIVGRGSVRPDMPGILGIDKLQRQGICGKGAVMLIISNGSEGSEQAMASGDLPKDTIRLDLEENGNDPNKLKGSEGTGMGELGADMATCAKIVIQAQGSNPLEFVGNIRYGIKVARKFGKTVAGDDTGWPSVSAYKDNVLAPALEEVLEESNDVFYGTSAGNNGASTHNGPYESNSIPLNGTYDSCHDFSRNNPIARPRDDAFYMQAPAKEPGKPASTILAVLHWNRPKIDFDLLATVLSDSTTTLSLGDTGSSTNLQRPSGEDPAIEEVSVINNTDKPKTIRFDVCHKTGSPSPDGVEVMLIGYGPTYSNNTTPDRRSIPGGQPIMPEVFTAGAANVKKVAESGASAPKEVYSSVGSPELHKPDGIVTDCVPVTGAGGFLPKPGDAFCGTSASSAITIGNAALIKGEHPEWTREQIRKAMNRTALDMGPKPAYGYGLIIPSEAIKFPPQTTTRK